VKHDFIQSKYSISGSLLLAQTYHSVRYTHLIREVIRKMQSSGVGGGSSVGDERPDVGNTRSSPYASMSSRNCPNKVSEN
jgi:hypothetical protein